MKVSLLTALLLLTSPLAFPADSDERSKESATASPFPLQLEARVPFAPTAFPSGDHSHVVYELYLTNFSERPIQLQRIDVLDARKPDSRKLASFEAESLDAVLQPVGSQAPENKADIREIRAGATVVAFIWIPINAHESTPEHLRHRVVTTSGTIEGVDLETHHDRLPSLLPPVRGKGWLASDGPSNVPNNHHRRGILAINGHVTTSRRYAIDWILQKDNASLSGNPQDLRSYYSYDQPVFAVADAEVVTARDGIPNNTPGSPETFRHAVPITMDTVGGNTVVLNLGSGQYAWYFHLAPGSIQVKAGERVRRGQLLARVGCSGDPTVPHLHFEVTSSPKLLGGEGLPYLIDHYRIWNDKKWESRTEELPLAGTVVEFGNDE